MGEMDGSGCLFGYRFVADYMQQRSDKQLEAHLDKNNYKESELIELKVPIHLPYQTTWAEFERYDGEVELNGILYKYVKRKVVNDTLVLLCIRTCKCVMPNFFFFDAIVSNIEALFPATGTLFREWRRTRKVVRVSENRRS